MSKGRQRIAGAFLACIIGISASGCSPLQASQSGPAADTPYVDFVVTAATGERLPGVTVTLSASPDIRHRPGFSDADGRFRADELTVSKVEARFDLEGFYSMTVHDVPVRRVGGLEPLQVVLISRAADVAMERH